MSNKGLEAARHALAQRKASGVTTKVLTPIQRLELNPTSLRQSVNAMCYDCQGRGADPGVIGRIRNCEIHSCPLFNVRPYQDKTNKRETNA